MQRLYTDNHKNPNKMEQEKFKKATINGIQIPVIVDNRALVDYKRDKGSGECKDIEDLLRLQWYGIKSGARRSGLKFEMDFEQFIDYTSEHPDYMPDDPESLEPNESKSEQKKSMT